MIKFELILENRKRRYYRNLSLFIILLNIAVFAILAFYTTEKTVFRNSILAIIVIGSFFLVERYYKKKNKEPFNAINAGLFFVMFSWAIMMYWWAAAVSLLLWIFYNISKRPLLVSFSEKEIVYPSFPKRQLDWKELDNSILKDGLLTIDFKNNKILQQLIDPITKPVDEKEFNDFCKMQLQRK